MYTIKVEYEVIGLENSSISNYVFPTIKYEYSKWSLPFNRFIKMRDDFSGIIVGNLPFNKKETDYIKYIIFNSFVDEKIVSFLFVGIDKIYIMNDNGVTIDSIRFR